MMIIIIIIIIIMIIINNSNKTYLCRMTISVIKTAIKEKKIKLGVISIWTQWKPFFIYIYIYIYIYIWDNSALMFSKQLLTSKSD